MAVILDVTPGSATANSYLTVEEAQTYWDTRGFTENWDNADDQAGALIWATRIIDMTLSPYSELVPASGSRAAYFWTHPAWTGAPTDGVQALAWPRIGMLTRNGFAIPSNVIPQDLKNAVAELAGSLSASNRLVDSDIAVQGITSVKAGSVSVSFKSDGIATLKTLPDAVWWMLVPSWVSQDIIEPVMSPLFDVI